MARNIAVIGALRSGKDSVATSLVANHGYTKMALADPLKDEVVTALNAVEGGWDRERLEREKTSLRSLLQVWGTEFRRNLDPGYWTNKLEARISEHHARDLDRIIVTDARFTNELDMLRRHQFTIVRLEMDEKTLRDHLHRVALMSDEQVDIALAHPSERQWRDYPADFEVASIPGKLPELIEVVTRIAGVEE